MNIKSRIIKYMIFLLIVGISSAFFIVAVSFFLGAPDLTYEKNTTIYSDDGHVIGYERGLENRQWVSLDEVNDHYIQAVLVAEDKHFYKHWGFDFKRMAQAMWRNIRAWSLKEGASTLTQQYARNLFLSHEKTWLRKIKEAFYTIRLEMFYSKDEIFEGYMNTIYFGHGAYGVETASHFFFNKQARDISLGEAAMLASIPRGPKYFSPLNNYQRANERQQLILRLMEENGYISTADYELARREHLSFKQTKQTKQAKLGHYFHDLVKHEASKLLQVDEATIRSNGYKIYTTMGVKEQIQLEKVIKETIDATSETQVGALAVDQHTGAIRALVGGRDYEKSPFNRVTMAKRMPGSAFKPLLYYVALDHHYTPSTRLTSQPTSFKLADNNVYTPRNYNGHYANGPITLAQALALSDNIYAVKTHLYLGVDKLPEYQDKFGLYSDLPKIPSLALGTATVSVYEMVTAFSRLANGGKEVNPYVIEKIVDQHGKTVFERRNHLKLRQVLDPKKTFILTQLLSGMFNPNYNDYMQVTGTSILDQLSHQYAGKSGTTSFDRWMVGYSPTLTTGVWVGYDDHREMEKISETNYAKTIWADFMEATHDQHKAETFVAPDGVVESKIDPITGLLATPYCPTEQSMYYEKGSEPITYCTVHLPEDVDIKEIVEPKDKKQSLFEKLIEIFSF